MLILNNYTFILYVSLQIRGLNTLLKKMYVKSTKHNPNTIKNKQKCIKLNNLHIKARLNE